jgi:acyl-CoA thioesterase
MNESLEVQRLKFKNDLFVAEGLQAEIEAVGQGFARCGMTILPRHCNALKIPMGGVIFTLADFAFAVAANQEGRAVVTQSAQITFLAPAAGSRLTAEATAVREGGHTSLYSVLVTDETGRKVAYATANGYAVANLGG